MQLLRNLFLLGILCTARTMVYCADSTSIKNTRLLTSRVKQYEKAEWDIILSAHYKNPYDQREIKLDLQLSTPSGKSLVLPAYYDVLSNTWKARFTPRETGKYYYTFILENGSQHVTTSKKSFNAATGKKKGFLQPNDLWTFRFDNGELFRGIGENIGWESRSFENDKWTYDHLLPTLSGNGANFFRTWMCYWNMPLEWKNPSGTKRYPPTEEYFHPGAVKRMEQLLSLCDSLQLYFMLTIDWHGHLMENGGWKNSNYNKQNGGPIATPAEFFTSDAAKAMYKNKLRYLVARWGYSSNIAVWEFFNEVDNAAFTGNDSVIIPLATITAWHEEMSEYLKHTDPYQHLVSTSISHRDIPGLNSIAKIDFNQKHIYKHTDQIPGIYPSYIEKYQKPYVVGEFGYRWEDANPKYAAAANFDYKRGLWYGLFSCTPILPMSWWWEFFDDQHMAAYFKPVSEINQRMLKAGKGKFEKINITASQVESYAIKCGTGTFVYLLNNSSQTQQPLLKIQLVPGVKLEQYNPDTGKYSQEIYTITKEGEIAIPGLLLPAMAGSILIFSTADR